MSGKRFRFTLDSVLRVRQHEAERAEQALARALADRQRREADAAAARADLDAVLARTASAGRVSTTDLRRRAALRHEAGQRVAAALGTLADGRTREADARKALAVRRSAEEALGALRTHEFDAHRLAALADEGAFLDEQGTAAFARARRGATAQEAA